MDLRHIVSRLLAGTTLLGAGVACKCPPSAPSVEVSDSAVVDELVAAAATLRSEEACEASCDGIDATVDGWSCRFEPYVAPTAVFCTPPTGGDPIEGTLPAEGTTRLSLASEDCQSVCKMTDGWVIAEENGVAEDGIYCWPQGETPEEVVLSCGFGSECVGGRRPAGPCPPALAGDDRGSWWAAMAQCEHISIGAFTDLARDLAHHGAPQDLVDRALAAAHDERRHTRLCVQRARALGVAVHVTDAPPTAIPGRSDFARHNAREGCVRETYAALEAGWQALRAIDPADRRVLAAIHDDEVRHGQLAWDIHAWLDDAALDGTLHAAFDELADASAGAGPRGLGLPTHAERRALIEALRQAA